MGPFSGPHFWSPVMLFVKGGPISGVMFCLQKWSSEFVQKYLPVGPPRRSGSRVLAVDAVAVPTRAPTQAANSSEYG